MTSECNVIYSKFLSKITDYDYVNMDETDALEIMHEKMIATMTKPYIRRLFTTITLNDEEGTITYELKNSIDDISDMWFTEEVIAKGMLIEWLEPQVNSVVNITQMYSGKEEKFYAQANHLSEIRKLLNDAKVELRKYVRDYGYINNSYIGG